MKLHEWKTRIQSGEHLLGTMVTTFASADLPKILKACGFDFFIIDCCRTQKRRSRRVSSSIMPSTRPWGTVVFPSPGRIRIF